MIDCCRSTVAIGTVGRQRLIKSCRRVALDFDSCVGCSRTGGDGRSKGVQLFALGELDVLSHIGTGQQWLGQPLPTYSSRRRARVRSRLSLALAVRRSRRSARAVLVAAALVAVVSAGGPLSAAQDTASGVLLAAMHLVTGAVFLATASRTAGPG